MAAERSIEQLVRDVLTQAIADGLVDEPREKWPDPDPQSRSAFDLLGCANLVAKWLSETNAR